MKKRMKFANWLLAATALCGMTACSDYDNGFDEKKISFEKEFVNAFDDIDPEQDWNLAERSFVTVTTAGTSQVKIYALLNGTYCIVGDYSDVSGTRELGFDMLEGTESIMVSDGRVAVQTVPGGQANLSDTRTVYPGNDFVKVAKITDPNGVTIGGVTYPMYKEATAQHYEAMKEVIPEIGNRKTYTNLNRVTHDFTYVSTGKFIIYPYYWETSSLNTIGIYYYDASGQRQEVDVYTIREGSELQFHKVVGVYRSSCNLEDASTGGNAQWYGDYKELTWTDRNDNLLKNMGLPNGNLLSRFATLTVDVTMKKYTPAIRVLFYKSDGTNKFIQIANPSPSASGEYHLQQTINLQSLVNSDASWRDFLENCSEVRIAGNNYDYGATEFSTPIGTSVIGDITINDIYFESNSDGGWQNYGEIFCSEIFTKYESDKMRGQGIVIDIPVGTVFGMYLKKSDWVNNEESPYTFYSEGSLNDPALCGNGVTDDNQGHVTEVQGMHPCYASTFHVNALGNQMFLGFEDWPNTANASDFDLNDVVFAFSGATPTIINQDTTPAGTWMLACEDLGGSFDLDYNDVVLKINHISGQDYATITPLAAGGTLASYIFFIDPQGAGSRDKCFGEVHQLFGVEAMTSGEYEAINVLDNNRGPQGREIRFSVDEDWSMAYYSSDTWDESSQYAPNMGGFEIRTLPKGEAPISNADLGPASVNSEKFSGASRIPAPDKGKAPFIICLPYSYTTTNIPSVGKKTEHVWAWPQEFVGITSCYPEFAAWVGDMTTHGDWYKNRRANSRTVDPLEIVTDMTAEEIAATVEGETEGTEVPTDKLIPTFFSTFGQTINTAGVYTNAWQTDAESHTVTLYTGEKIKVAAYLTEYSGSGSLSARLSAGETGSVATNSGNEFYVTGGNTSGSATLTVHFSGDDTYQAKDIIIYINVKERKLYRFVSEVNGQKWALTRDNSAVIIKPLNENYLDPNQIWGIEREGGKSAYSFIYSAGAAKYLVSAAGSNPWACLLQEDRPDNNEYGRFKLTTWTNGSGVELTQLYLRHYERDLELHRNNVTTPVYVGVNSWADGQTVYMDKTGSQVFNFTLSPVDVTGN